MVQDDRCALGSHGRRHPARSDVYPCFYFWIANPGFRDDAELARVGTFFASRTFPYGDGAGIFDLESEETLILMFVDRPCEISGMIVFDGMTIMHDLEFSVPGFHWVRVTRDGGLIANAEPQINATYMSSSAFPAWVNE